MDNSELTQLLLSQLKDRDDMIKTLANKVTELSDAYIQKDKEKDKRHNKTIIGVIALCLITMAVVICVFTCSYFFSDYAPDNAIYGNNNSTSNISGNSNHVKFDKGGDK